MEGRVGHGRASVWNREAMLTNAGALSCSQFNGPLQNRHKRMTVAYRDDRRTSGRGLPRDGGAFRRGSGHGLFRQGCRGHLCRGQQDTGRAARQTAQGRGDRTFRRSLSGRLARTIPGQDRETLAGAAWRRALEKHLHPGGGEGWCLTWKEPVRDPPGGVIETHRHLA